MPWRLEFERVTRPWIFDDPRCRREVLQRETARGARHLRFVRADCLSVVMLACAFESTQSLAMTGAAVFVAAKNRTNFGTTCWSARHSWRGAV